MDPNGTHPLEVWTGIIGIASYFRLMGESQTAEAICSAVVDRCTAVAAVPHAGGDHRSRDLRACHYLQAMAI